MPDKGSKTTVKEVGQNGHTLHLLRFESENGYVAEDRVSDDSFSSYIFDGERAVEDYSYSKDIDGMPIVEKHRYSADGSSRYDSFKGNEWYVEWRDKDGNLTNRHKEFNENVCNRERADAQKELDRLKQRVEEVQKANDSNSVSAEQEMTLSEKEPSAKTADAKVAENVQQYASELKELTGMDWEFKSAANSGLKKDNLRIPETPELRAKLKENGIRYGHAVKGDEKFLYVETDRPLHLTQEEKEKSAAPKTDDRVQQYASELKELTGMDWEFKAAANSGLKKDNLRVPETPELRAKLKENGIRYGHAVKGDEKFLYVETDRPLHLTQEEKEKAASKTDDRVQQYASELKELTGMDWEFKAAANSGLKKDNLRIPETPELRAKLKENGIRYGHAVKGDEKFLYIETDRPLHLTQEEKEKSAASKGIEKTVENAMPAPQNETPDLHPVRVETGIALASKGVEKTVENAMPAPQNETPDLHPVRVETGIAPTPKGIEKADDTVLEVSEQEAKLLLSMEGYGKAPNKENLETFMVDLKALMQDYASAGLNETQAVKKANDFMSEQIGRAETIGADPRIIANLKDVEKASHAFFASKAAEQNAPAPAIEPTEFAEYEEVKDDEKSAEKDPAEIAGKEAEVEAEAEPVEKEPVEIDGKESDINEKDPVENAVTAGERDNGPQKDKSSEKEPVLNSISNGDDNDGYQKNKTNASAGNVNDGAGADDDFAPNPGPLEDQESLMKQANDLRYWMEYFKLEGADMDPPRATPFADIKRVRPNDDGSKLFSLGRRKAAVPGAIMDLDTGNSVLSTPNRLVLQLDTDQEGKGNKQPSFKDCMTMVLEARERGWNSLRITGSPEFQKQMYLACVAMGMKTKDFVPTQEMLNEAQAVREQFCPEGKPSLKQHCADLDKRFPQLEELQSTMPEPPMTKQERKNFDKRMPTFETIRVAKERGLGSAYAKTDEKTDDNSRDENPEHTTTPEENLTTEPKKPVVETDKGKEPEKPTVETDKGKEPEKPAAEAQKDGAVKALPAKTQEDAAVKALPAKTQEDAAVKALPVKTQEDAAVKALPVKTQKDAEVKALPAKIESGKQEEKKPIKEAAADIWKAETSVLKDLQKDSKKPMTAEQANRNKLLWEAVKLEAELAVTASVAEAKGNPQQVGTLTKETLLARANHKVDEALKKGSEPKDIAKAMSEFKKTRMAHEPQNTKDCRAMGFKTQRPADASKDLNPKIIQQKKDKSR